MFDYSARPELLKGRVILVTGAGRGIGAAAAKTYAAHGATVLLLGKTEANLAQVYDEIEAAGQPQPVVIPFNLETALPHQYDELAAMIEKEFGHLDGLLHNASIIGPRTPIEQLSGENFMRVMHVNVNAMFMLTSTLLPLLKLSQDASVVFTSSSVGRKGRAYWGAYGVSKFATEGLMQTLADELDYRVVATSRSIKPSTDPDILTVAGDIADPATAERVIREGVARFGRIDSLINNAGIFVAKPFTSYTHEDYVNVLAVNLNGFFYITQLAITEMLKQGAGHIVNITTSLVDHAIDGVPSVLASLTKGGLNSATKSLAIEYAKRGIRVNAVSPGIIKTPMHGEETHAALGSLHPVGHMGEARDIAQAIVYLESAGFVTGEILHVDGGQSAGH